MKNFISFIIKVSISIALLAFLFSRIDLKKTIFCMRTVEPQYFIYAVLLFLLVAFLGIVRWSVLLRIVKKDLSFQRIFISNCGGLFFNVFLPSTIGGDIVRTVDLSLHTKDNSSIFATVFLDRLCGLSALLIIAFSGFSFGYLFGFTKDYRLFLFIVIFAALVLFVYLLIFNKKVFALFNKIIKFNLLRSYLTKFHNSCYSFRFQKKVLLKAIILSLLIQGGYSIVLYFLGKSLGVNLNIVYFLIFIPIVNIISFLPISLGGLGLRDNVAVVLFSTLGVASDRVAAMTLINFAFLLFIGIVGGIVYSVALSSRRL